MPAIQIRHVPEEVHRRLKERAALAGQSLSEHTLATLMRSLERPTLDELIARIEERGCIDPGGEVSDMVRAERDSR